ncbi:MAG: nucleotidyltransferase [Armatimonadetes bacterium]|nr:nucleotidyltransferase [Armatimonadota bacterium]
MAPRIDVNRDAVASFCRENHIRWLALFGSVLRDDFGPESDVDVVVDFEPGTQLGLIGLAGIEIELGELLGREAHLSEAEALDPRFRNRVLAEAEEVYAA